MLVHAQPNMVYFHTFGWHALESKTFKNAKYLLHSN